MPHIVFGEPNIQINLVANLMISKKLIITMYLKMYPGFKLQVHIKTIQRINISGWTRHIVFIFILKHNIYSVYNTV